jgi:hypothetical protein
MPPASCKTQFAAQNRPAWRIDNAVTADILRTPGMCKAGAKSSHPQRRQGHKDKEEEERAGRCLSSWPGLLLSYSIQKYLFKQVEPTSIAQHFPSMRFVHARAQTKGPYMLCCNPITELRRESQT